MPSDNDQNKDPKASPSTPNVIVTAGWSEWFKVAVAVFVCALVGILVLELAKQPSQTTKSVEGAFERTVKSKSLRVGYVVIAPWIMKDANSGRLSGSSVDTITEIARLADWKVGWVEQSWSTFIVALNQGHFDVSIAPSYVTVPRALTVSFTDPISWTGNSVLVKADSKFASLTDLDKAGVKIAVAQGEEGHEFARANFRNAEIRPIVAKDPGVLFVEVVSGRADAALNDAWTIAQYVQRNPTLVRDMLPNRPYNILPASWAVRYEDRSLKEFLNAGLLHLESSGFLATLDGKYNVPNVRRLAIR